MSAVRVLVVDDEPLARAGLRAILREERDLSVVGESGCGADAIAAIERAGAGCRVPRHRASRSRRLRRGRVACRQSDRPAIVFVTAHSDQALRAFETRALDYVTKPIRRERVREAVARARERIRLERLDRQSPAPPAAPAPARPDGPLALKIDGRVQLIDPQSIDWVAADDDHVLVHCGDRVWRCAGDAARGDAPARSDAVRPDPPVDCR